jgi:soluble lytic murein transglycosylase-like protein
LLFITYFTALSKISSTGSHATFNPISHSDLVKIIKSNHHNPELIIAMITIESAWNSKAISKSGAVGLMQVLPSSARMVGLDYDKNDLLCPEKNIEAGCKILKYYQKRYKKLSVVLSKYSGGANRYYHKVMKAMNA